MYSGQYRQYMEEREMNKNISNTNISKPNISSKPYKSYSVDFYDLMDGWCHWGDFFPEYAFDTLEEAKTFADIEYSKMKKQNKDAGEHYAVFHYGRNVYSTNKSVWFPYGIFGPIRGKHQ
jgi:hypothetical protein